MEAIIVDTGPLVAYLDRREEHHEWVLATLRELTEPLLTCDAVLIEAAHVLNRKGQPTDLVFSLMTEGLIKPCFEITKHWRELATLMRTYRAVPMSVTDACLVRMSEVQRSSVVFTLDRDFLIYRRNGRQRIPLLAPFV